MKAASSSWLIFFSSLPSKPVGSRVKVWRKLAKAGAIQFKGAVYLLPDSRENLEFFQWLAGEIRGLGGEAAFVRADRVETVPDGEIVALFERRKSLDYDPLREALGVLERRIDGARQGAPASTVKGLQGRFARFRRDFEEAQRTDFFASADGRDLGERIERAQTDLSALAQAAERRPAPAAIPDRSPDAYRGRRWVTRSAPFVDRMASAWLIRKFIDPAAEFRFIEEEEVAAATDAVAFDVRGGEFAHVDDLCTFEILVRSFGLNDASLAKIVEIVHDLDVRDERYRRAENPGVEEILDGIRRTARDDADALERGMAIFEMLYAAGSR
jgi:hypothetical protein